MLPYAKFGHETFQYNVFLHIVERVTCSKFAEWFWSEETALAVKSLKIQAIGHAIKRKVAIFLSWRRVFLMLPVVWDFANKLNAEQPHLLPEKRKHD